MLNLKKFLSPFPFTKALKKTFSTSQNLYEFEYPDEIIVNLKKSLSNKESIDKIEDSITNNIHYFDSEEFTDIVTLLGINKKGSNDLWDLLERKSFDYEFNFVQAKEIFNSIVESKKPLGSLEMRLIKELAKVSGDETSNEITTYRLFI